ncbi:FAD-binding protein [Paraburkholderia phenazinium]|uniref:FAD-binding protein n=1 Tax=Paraburkholderia phenazinium TaxID=60549 RepID=UPI00209AF266|nr:FAD-binding protein [Paraburkholderia phenazinium]
MHVRSHRGVVIATGGYPGNSDMCREHSRAPIANLTLGLAGNVGERSGLGLSTGGQLDHNSSDMTSSRTSGLPTNLLAGRSR